MLDWVMFVDVVKYKKVFFYSAHVNYDVCLTGELRLVFEGVLLEVLDVDFR